LEPVINIASNPGPRTRYRRALLAAMFCSALIPSVAVEQVLFVDAGMNEQVVMIPAGVDGTALLETTLFRPDGPGPFPLLVINHGKQAGSPRHQQRDRFIFLATAFVKRGYAVMVPMRQGYASSTGTFVDHGCDMTANGYAQADDVIDAIDYARTLSYVDDSRIVVAGQSYGGMATVALGTHDIPGVRGLINFSGGLRDNGGTCNWQSALVKAFARYGAANRVDSLWMYGANDSHFSPGLVTRMFGAYTRSGGQGSLVRYGPFKRDSHAMIASRDGDKVWLPEVEQFLQKIGMPTKESFTVITPPTLPRTNYADLSDVEAVPYLSETGRAAYKDYLSKITPRAFAVSPSGAWSWAEDGEDPDNRALAACGEHSKEPCRLYSVDDYVVWPVASGAPATMAVRKTIAPTTSGHN
jgi:dienelactone hydrolase